MKHENFYDPRTWDVGFPHRALNPACLFITNTDSSILSLGAIIMNTPIIKVELEFMKQSMHHAFSQQVLEMDKMFKEALEQALDPERIKNLLLWEAERQVKGIIDEAVKNAFQHDTPGRRFMEEAVRDQIKQLIDNQDKNKQEKEENNESE